MPGPPSRLRAAEKEDPEIIATYKSARIDHLMGVKIFDVEGKPVGAMFRGGVGVKMFGGSRGNDRRRECASLSGRKKNYDHLRTT